MADELRYKIIKETGLPNSFGLSINKTVSKVATGEAKPNNRLEIAKGEEKHFLAPLSVRKIPMVGEKTYQTLRNLGVQRIKTVQEMPQDMMERVLGQNGSVIWKKANGVDNSPVIPHSDRKSISTERTFDRDTTDVVKLKGIMLAMGENLAFQLRRGKRLTGCVTVKVRYSDFQTQTPAGAHSLHVGRPHPHRKGPGAVQQGLQPPLIGATDRRALQSPRRRGLPDQPVRRL